MRKILKILHQLHSMWFRSCFQLLRVIRQNWEEVMLTSTRVHRGLEMCRESKCGVTFKMTEARP